MISLKDPVQGSFFRPITVTRDQKIAFLLAPFLLVGGYVVTDSYLESNDGPSQLFELKSTADCRLFEGNCILESGDMQVNVSDTGGVTMVNASYPADSIALSLVYRDGREVVYALEPLANPQYWQRETNIRGAISEGSAADRMRIVVQVKEKHFLGEFFPAELNN